MYFAYILHYRRFQSFMYFINKNILIKFSSSKNAAWLLGYPPFGPLLNLGIL